MESELNAVLSQPRVMVMMMMMVVMMVVVVVMISIIMMMIMMMMVVMEFTNIIKVMDSGPMQLAMIISAITFAQTSILNYTYFLNNVFRSIVRLNHVLCLLKYPSRLIGAL